MTSVILFSGCYFHAGECQSALGESPAGQLACVTCMNRTIRVSRALRVLCGCGGSYRRKHKAYHLQTTKHRKWEEKTAESEPQKERERVFPGRFHEGNEAVCLHDSPPEATQGLKIIFYMMGLLCSSRLELWYK